MDQINKQPFGKTGHFSSRAIFGSVSVRDVSQDVANQVLDTLLSYGVNHIDTAPAYGDAEVRVGGWMKHHREKFFVATKIDKRTYQEAREQFYRSLDRLQTDRVDLLQIHNFTDVVYREFTMGPEGALEFLIEAQNEGLAGNIGITGHGIQTPKMHMQSLQRFGFNSVLLPCNYLMMQIPHYKNDFNQLISYCRENEIAVQFIKAAARGLWGDKARTHSTWYEPLNDNDAIRKSVHWVMNQEPEGFLITTGDKEVLPQYLAAVADFSNSPSDAEMEKMVTDHAMQPLFNQ